MFKKKKSKADLDLYSKALKKRKKHKGKSSGSRFNLAKIAAKKGSTDSVDERLGSKKPIPLIADSAIASKKVNPIASSAGKKSRQAWMDELKALENNAYLNTLMDKLENEAHLTQKEEQDFDKMMDRLEWLMAKLGIEVDTEDDIHGADDEDDKNKFEIMHLLK